MTAYSPRGLLGEVEVTVTDFENPESSFFFFFFQRFGPLGRKDFLLPRWKGEEPSQYIRLTQPSAFSSVIIGALPSGMNLLPPGTKRLGHRGISSLKKARDQAIWPKGFEDPSSRGEGYE